MNIASFLFGAIASAIACTLAKPDLLSLWIALVTGFCACVVVVIAYEITASTVGTILKRWQA